MGPSRSDVYWLALPPSACVVHYTDDLINYIDVCITELTALYPGVVTILAGDFNQLSDCDLVQRTGLTPA